MEADGYWYHRAIQSISPKFFSTTLWLCLPHQCRSRAHTLDQWKALRIILSQITAVDSSVKLLQTAKAPRQPRNLLDSMRLGTALPDIVPAPSKAAKHSAPTRVPDSAGGGDRFRVGMITWVGAGLNYSLSFSIILFCRP